MFDQELDDADSWYRSLGRVARSAQGALPGVIQGVKTGAVAGPWGAVAGGVAGGVSRVAMPRRAAVRTPAPVPPAPAQPLPPAPQSPAPAPGIESPAAPVGGGTANPAAAELLALLRDPRLAAAITAGAQGQREVPVAGTSAPPAAFMNLLSWLAQEAAQQAPAGQPPVDGYLRGPDGSYVADVASPAARARVLLERLQGERAGEGARTEPAGGAEQWLIESGLAELV